MDKINYNQHDWNKGEVIKEENLDNMENGIKQATDKINEIIDTEQDFKDRMADIDGRIDINNEELVIARDGCDNLGQRIERDQQYIYNILNDGSYLEFNGTDIDINNAKEGYTKDTILKGQTYQNLIKNGQQETELNVSINTHAKYSYNYALKNNTDYTLIFTANSVSDTNTVISFNEGYLGIERKILNGVNIVKTHTNDKDEYLSVWFYYNNGATSDKVTGTIKNVILLEGDWTNKEVPSSITGIESVGDKENNKISILSHATNVINPQKLFSNNNEILKENDEFICPADVSWQNEKVKGLDLTKPIYFAYEIKADEDITIDSTNSNLLVRLDYIKTGGNIGGTSIALGTKITNKYTKLIFKNIVVSQTNSEKGINLVFRNGVGKRFYVKNITLTNTPIDDIVPYKEDKKEILLPIENGLKSLPDGACDTIEQREDGVYLVQRVEKKVIDRNVTSLRLNGSSDTHTQFTIGMEGIKQGQTQNVNLICNTKPVKAENEGSDSVWIYRNSMVVFQMTKEVNTIELFKQWLDNNPTFIYFELATPIETKLDLDTLNLETFKDKTYILSKNNIKPEIVCKAPVDVNQTIADLQGEQEQLIETYNTLKEENEAVKTAISELNEQEDVQTADMLDLDMRVLALEEGLE